MRLLPAFVADSSTAQCSAHVNQSIHQRCLNSWWTLAEPDWLIASFQRRQLLLLLLLAWTDNAVISGSSAIACGEILWRDLESQIVRNQVKIHWKVQISFICLTDYLRILCINLEATTRTRRVFLFSSFFSVFHFVGSVRYTKLTHVSFERTLKLQLVSYRIVSYRKLMIIGNYHGG